MCWNRLITRPITRLLERIILASVVKDAAELRRFLLKRWPQLESRIPEGLHYVNPYRLTMSVSDSKAPFWKWVFSRGGLEFLDPAVPDPYFACGCLCRGNPEWLLVMWREGDRRFWFSEKYVVLMSQIGFCFQPRQDLTLVKSGGDEVAALVPGATDVQIDGGGEGKLVQSV